LDDIWYGRFAIGDYPEIILFNTIMADEQTCEVESTVAPFAIGP
jgi:hypothetical protein